jgi:hypothetical protein
MQNDILTVKLTKSYYNVIWDIAFFDWAQLYQTNSFLQIPSDIIDTFINSHSRLRKSQILEERLKFHHHEKIPFHCNDPGRDIKCKISLATASKIKNNCIFVKTSPVKCWHRLKNGLI